MRARNVTIDCMRTFAIVQMVIFHFIFDLGMFNFHDWNIPDGPVWKQWRECIVGLFLICVGVGLVFSHASGIRWRPFTRRFLLILGSAFLISLVSLQSHPDRWIFFGVLHFIACASLLTLPLVRWPKIALLLAFLNLVIFFLGWLPPWWPYYALFPGLPRYSVDFVPVFPWISAVWFGVWLGHSDWLKKDPLASWRDRQWLLFPGQHSLLIYMLHQPVLIGSLAAIDYVVR